MILLLSVIYALFFILQKTTNANEFYFSLHLIPSRLIPGVPLGDGETVDRGHQDGSKEHETLNLSIF